VWIYLNLITKEKNLYSSPCGITQMLYYAAQHTKGILHIDFYFIDLCVSSDFSGCNAIQFL
jgi:hypothetical protein